MITDDDHRICGEFVVHQILISRAEKEVFVEI
jgi:hypothetical protein